MGRSCLKYFLQQRILVSFAFFVVKKGAVMMLFDADWMRILSEKMTKKRAV